MPHLRKMAEMKPINLIIKSVAFILLVAVCHGGISGCTLELGELGYLCKIRHEDQSRCYVNVDDAVRISLIILGWRHECTLHVSNTSSFVSIVLVGHVPRKENIYDCGKNNVVTDEHFIKVDHRNCTDGMSYLSVVKNNLFCQ